MMEKEEDTNQYNPGNLSSLRWAWWPLLLLLHRVKQTITFLRRSFTAARSGSRCRRRNCPTRAAVTAIDRLSVYTTTAAHADYGSNPLRSMCRRTVRGVPPMPPDIEAPACLYAFSPTGAGVTHSVTEVIPYLLEVMTTASATDFMATGQSELPLWRFCYNG